MGGFVHFQQIITSRQLELCYHPAFPMSTSRLEPNKAVLSQRLTNWKILICACSLLTLAALGLSAQTNTAVVRGSVTDPGQAVVAGAKVSLSNQQTAVAYTATTNEAGLYSIPDVPAGAYSMTVDSPGFKRYVHQGLTVNTGQTLSLEVTLELGTVSESVTVTGGAPLVQNSTSDVNQLIESKSIADIPLGDRRTMNVIQLSSAAVFTGYDNGQKPNFSIAGGRAQSQMYWIDGASGQNMRLGIGQIDTDPPVELIAEIKVLSNSYSAEFGGSNGGVVIETTKSGSNQFHGSALEYLRNNLLDAPGFFAPVVNGAKIKPKLRYNLYGGTVGGPIWKNKTFFFFDYEGSARRTGYTSTMTVPDALQRIGDFSKTTTAAGAVIPIYDPATTPGSVRQPFAGNRIPTTRLDPVALKLLAYYPVANRPATNLTGANNYSANGVNTLQHDFWSLKVDHNFGSKDRISGRYMFNRDNTNVISAFPDPGPDPTTFNVANQKSALGDWIHTFTPSTVNELRVNVARRIAHALSAGVGGDYLAKIGLNGLTSDAFPNVQTAGLVTLGNTNQERQQYPIDQQQVVENISSLRGRHSLKAGFEIRRSRNHEINLPTAAGSFTFATTPTGLPGNASTGIGTASLLLGFPTAFTAMRTQELDRHSFYLAGFVQDDFNVSRSLTLNLGVRWETDTPMVDANNRENGFDGSAINPVSGTPGVVKFMGVNGFRTSPYDLDWNNFGPRAGFAWKVLGSERTVVRGGFGIFFAHPFDAGVPNAIALGYSVSQTINSPDNGITAPFFLRNGVPNTGNAQPVLNDSFGAVAVGQNANTAVTFFEPNRASGYSEQFNFAVQHQFSNDLVVEVSTLGNLGRKLPSANLSLNQILPSLLGPTHQSQRDRPYPQFSNVSVQSPTLGVSNYYGGVARVERRFANGFNLNASYTFSKFLENTNDTGTTAGRDTGPYQDFYNRRADYGPSANDIRHRFVFSMIYEFPFGRGRPYLTNSFAGKILGGWTVGNVTTLQSGPPISVITQTNNCNCFSSGSQRPNVLRDPNLDSADKTIARWFDTSAFAQPSVFTFGNSGRNIVRAPGILNTDFSLIRNFRFGERFNLQVRGESFNATNHTNFSAPAGTFGGAGFGTISASGPARQNQIGMRFSF